MSDEYKAKLFNKILQSLAGKPPAYCIEMAIAIVQMSEDHLREEWCSHGNGD